MAAGLAMAAHNRAVTPVDPAIPTCSVAVAGDSAARLPVAAFFSTCSFVLRRLRGHTLFYARSH